jgi:hypothetical protein
MSNVIELKRKAPKPTATQIICGDCEGEAWDIITYNLPDDIYDGLSIACFQCRSCGSQVDAAILWPEEDQ